ncbi:hypothetical protein [Almyronema epifaneia]
MDRSRYPANWEAIALKVKEAAQWECQCCRRPCRPTGMSVEDFELALIDHHHDWLCDFYKTVWDEEFGEVNVATPQRFTLTVAHLDQNPANNAPENLKALCSGCHLAHDRPHRLANRARKLERQGQLNLLGGGNE